MAWLREYRGERNCRYIFYQENHTYTKIEKPHYCYKLLTCLLPYWIVCQEISHGHLPSHHMWTHKFHTRISGKKSQMQQIAPSFCFVVKKFKKIYVGCSFNTWVCIDDTSPPCTKPLWKLHKSNVACNINPPTAKSDKQLISNIKVMRMEEMT